MRNWASPAAVRVCRAVAPAESCSCMAGALVPDNFARPAVPLQHHLELTQDCTSESPLTPHLSTSVPSKQKGSKVLADAMEALLGAFVVAGGHSAALAFLQAGAGCEGAGGGSLWGGCA